MQTRGLCADLRFVYKLAVLNHSAFWIQNWRREVAENLAEISYASGFKR
jgi:hypothetical protein